MNHDMNPILKYLNNLFAKRRVLGGETQLKGLAATDALLLDLVNTKRVPGLSITALKKGNILLQKGYGYADLENKVLVDPKRTVFRVASVSKPIAATALAIMVSEGLIDLDSSFYEYVPYYPKKKWDFTIRHLASHTAGIRGYKGMEYGLNRPYNIKQSIEIFKDDELLFEPGTGYLYNSFDWVLISLAMQEASSVPFEAYVQEKVLEPLGMIHTYTPENRPLSPANEGVNVADFVEQSKCTISNFYSKSCKGFRNAVPVNNFYKLAGGGYLSTSEDIAQLGQAYLEGTILNHEIRSRFLTSQKIDGDPIYYGLGWQVSKDAKGRPFYGHIGNGVGGYSNFFVYPEEKMVISILINCTDPKVQRTLDEVVDLLLEESDLL